jgi:protoheme IX farnesyltransferase
VNLLRSIAGLIRLAHPFPSVLCASATTAIAALAGATPVTAMRLGVAMLAIQVSIGALNDLVDVPLDALEKPDKPIASGLVGRRIAGVVTVAGALVGIVLSSVSGPPTAMAAVACLALGYAYDLRLSRTPVSWLPLALALPLLPIHAWLGAAGTIPTGLLTLVPVAVLGGAGLALANGLADFDRDASTGRRTVAVALGRRRALAVQTLLLAIAAGIAVVAAPAVGDGGASAVPGVLGWLRAAGIWAGVVALALGAPLLASERAWIRERGWELEAVGVASLGLGWLAGTASTVIGGGAGA